MAVTLNPRAERLLARLPRVTVYSGLELLLLALIAVQGARLFWAVLTPVGPVGDWKALDLIAPAPASAPALGSFDPFFRDAPAAGQGPAVVTTLNIRLYGVLGNQATGGGSAIIGGPTGEQRSYEVGEEIMPGVTLTAIGFDHVTIGRGGTSEQLFLDQSNAAASGATQPGPVPAVPQVNVPMPVVNAPRPSAPATPVPAPVANPVQSPRSSW